MENYAGNLSYPESDDSSLRSREIEFENPPPWEDDSQNNQLPPNFKVTLMCSYGGNINPRQHDNQLSYIGGETKILVVDRNTKFASLLSKLIALCDKDGISFKYQLPGEELDSLISVTSNDDFENMMMEYDRLYRNAPKPTRLRIFIFPSQTNCPSLNSSARSFGSEEEKFDKERLVEAVNVAPILTVRHPHPPPPASNGDLAFGLEKINTMVVAPPAQNSVVVRRVEEHEDPGLNERLIRSDQIQKHIQDLQRLRLEEEQQQQKATNYHRKIVDNPATGEYFKVPETIQHGGVPYWTGSLAPAAGVFPTRTGTVNTDQQFYMTPSPAGAYHAPMVRQVTGAPTQGYYTVQRTQSTEVYREQQQQQMYNGIPPSSVQPMPPPQKMEGLSDGYGMVRETSGGGAGTVTEPGYTQVAYDAGGTGRHVMYGAPPQYQAMGAAMSADMRPGHEALCTDAGGRVIAGKSTPSFRVT